MKGKRIAITLAVAGALGMTGANAQPEEPSADELSSMQWRDCAGHFFFLSKMLGNGDNAKATQRFKSWGILALYAGETKAKAEAANGATSDGLGKSIADPETGKLNADIGGMIERHAGKVKNQGRDEYVKAYSAQCGKPIAAYAKRFMKSMEAAKQEKKN